MGGGEGGTGRIPSAQWRFVMFRLDHCCFLHSGPKTPVKFVLATKGPARRKLGFLAEYYHLKNV
jgi:hypothetical protein